MVITMVGTGYVGLVSGVCLAEMGHEVTCIDIDQKKIDLLKDGVSPIYEPGIEKLIRQNQDQDRLFFSTQIEDSINQSDVIFIAVGTPSNKSGEANINYVTDVANNIAKHIDKDILIIIKSTVPVGTCDKVENLIKQKVKSRNLNLNLLIASNPEFLKEGNAISDFMQPDRIIVGLKEQQGEVEIKQLYRHFVMADPSKLLIVDRKASEMIKYTSNAMLASRISFMNELSRLCDKLDVDIDQVRLGVGTDSRIGKKFLYSGPGYGGSCFPKDVDALINMGSLNQVTLSILSAVKKVNNQQKVYVADKIKNFFGDMENITIGLWGLSFKPGTDDVREAPSKTIIEKLLGWGTKIIAHDPQGISTFKAEFNDHPNLKYVNNYYDAAIGTHAIVLITEWAEYKWPNWKKISKSVKDKNVFDFRNQYETRDDGRFRV